MSLALLNVAGTWNYSALNPVTLIKNWLNWGFLHANKIWIRLTGTALYFNDALSIKYKAPAGYPNSNLMCNGNINKIQIYKLLEFNQIIWNWPVIKIGGKPRKNLNFG